MIPSTGPIKHVYDGNDVTSLWPYTFPIATTDGSDVLVYLTDPDDVRTLLTSNYSVDVAGSQVLYPIVTDPIIDPLPTGWKITLLRMEPLTQLMDLLNQGAFNAETLETAFDKLTMICQQLQDQVTTLVAEGLTGEAGILLIEQLNQLVADALTSKNESAASAVESAASAVAAAASAVAAAASAADIDLPAIAGSDALDLIRVNASKTGYEHKSMAEVVDINGQTEKTSIIGDDLFLIEDSAAANAKKKIKRNNIGSGESTVLWGLEIADTTEDDAVVTIRPGYGFHGAIGISKTVNTVLTFATDGHWFDGSAHSYGGGAGLCYIGYDSSGNIRLLGANPPDCHDIAGNAVAGATDLYFDDTGGVSGEYWRVIGAIWIDTDDLATEFYHQGAPLSGFGMWESKSNNTVYEAATDGIVTAYTVNNAAAQNIEIKTDGNNPPTTRRIYNVTDLYPTGTMCPVKKGDYWKAEGLAQFVWWLPLGK